VSAQDQTNQQLDDWVKDLVGDDVEDFEPSPPSQDSITVTQWLRAIGALGNKIQRYKEQRDEAKHYYAMKIQKAEMAIEYIEGKILGFLRFRNVRNIATPIGTAYIIRSTTKLWSDDEEKLVQWVKENCPVALRQKTAIDKKAVSDYIKETGNIPPGYEEQQRDSIGIRT